MISSITLAGALAGFALAKEAPTFRPGRATDYAHQTSEQITIGAKPFDTQQLVAEAFGKKVDLLRYGVVPVLVVIENKRERTIDLNDIEVSLVAADGRHATAVKPGDLFSLGAPHKRPSSYPMPLPVPLPKKKNRLSGPEIVERSFSAKMLPPGDSASGFFYFEAKPEAGDKIYLNGLRDTPSGKEMIYFEFPFDDKSK